MTLPPSERLPTGSLGHRTSGSPAAGGLVDGSAGYRAPTGRHRRADGPVPARAGSTGGTRRPSRNAGRRRAAEDNPWAVAADAAQAARRAAIDLSRRALPVAVPVAPSRPLSIEVRAEPSPGIARRDRPDHGVGRRHAGRDRPDRGTARGSRRAAEPPATRRAAGAVREWATADARTAPVTGSHRAPGTLPLESWLLIGRYRQQALLAALVAVGILLIAIPVQQRSAVDTASADRTVSPVESGRSGKAPKQTAPAGSGKQRTRPTPGAPAPAASTGRSTTPPAPEAPTVAPPEPSQPSASTPPGDAAEESGGRVLGPARSRRLTGSDTVALTFDDGPDPVQTPKLLALLAQHQVKATFCLVGRQVRAHPDIVRQIAAGGHTLCNHTWDHSFALGKESPKDIRADLEATSAAIRDAVPDAEIPYFRAPGGFFTDRLVAAAGDYGMISIYWQVDPRDWERQNGETDEQHVDRVVRTVRSELRPGAIVLSHDFNQPGTITAYERLLPYIAGSFRTGLP